jgi:hypothetical protein
LFAEPMSADDVERLFSHGSDALQNVA